MRVVNAENYFKTVIKQFQEIEYKDSWSPKEVLKIVNAIQEQSQADSYKNKAQMENVQFTVWIVHR